MAGRLDASQAAAAQAFLDRMEGNITLDCTALDYVSSAGLGVLLKTQKRLLTQAGKLRLTNVNRHLQDIFSRSSRALDARANFVARRVYLARG